jgi:hypothetical protein
MELALRIDVLAMAGKQIVHRHDLMPSGEICIDDVRTDKSSSPSNQNVSHSNSFVEIYS